MNPLMPQGIGEGEDGRGVAGVRAMKNGGIENAGSKWNI